MGQAMGADFGGVRVHTDVRSDQLNQSIQAKAFTTGRDVFFRQGEYKPGSREGLELIAHELTHVVQQRGGDGPGIGAKEGATQGLRKSAAAIHIARWPNRQRTSKTRQWGDRSMKGRPRYAAVGIPLHVTEKGIKLRKETKAAGDEVGGISNYVYVGTSRGEGTYVGITNGPQRRQESHAARFHLHILNRGRPLSRIEVRGIEQWLILLGKHSIRNQNVANSISADKPYYKTAMKFGEAFWEWARSTNRDLLRFLT